MKIDKRLSQLEAVTTENKVLGITKVDGKIRAMNINQTFESIEEARELYPDYTFYIYTIGKPQTHENR